MVAHGECSVDSQRGMFEGTEDLRDLVGPGILHVLDDSSDVFF